jgi:hypothetical protein
MLKTLIDIARAEPALVSGAVTAILAALVAFGVHVTPDQAKALAGCAVPVLILAGAVVTRQTVTPNAKLPK